MRLSRSTILAPVPDSTKVLMVQPLSGQVAVLDTARAQGLRALEAGGPIPDGLSLQDLRAGDFVVEGDDDDRRLTARAYSEFLDETHKTATQLIVVPSFGCNFKCTYCYQEPFDPTGGGLIAPETIDAFFAWVEKHHGHERPRPYITLFGGEPLIDTPAHRDRLGRFLDGARARSLTVAVVTNGFDLASYADQLAAGPIREVQVTIDGPREVHDKRRFHVTGQGTFERVVAGVQALVDRGVPVNLRLVADRENIGTLPALAEFADARGWLALPESKFKTQIGRNYELFGCASRQKRDELFDRVEIWARFAELAATSPALKRFHRPRFHGLRHLAETGEFPLANFDACPAAKTEWAFAPDGSVYGCTATVGNEQYRLGRFHPTPERDEAAIAKWSGRSVLTIEKCQGCASATVCGGGCGAVAAHRHDGDPRAPDCRPIEQLFGLGAKYYGLAED